MKERESSESRVLLFDLGGVLVEWDGIRPVQDLSRRELSDEDVRLFWLNSRFVRDFERGMCSPAEFARGVVEELDLRTDADKFLLEFASWARGPLPGAHALLEELEEGHVRACLSNNNAIHWDVVRDVHGFGRLFDHSYLSHEIGLIKPDAAVFEYVLDDLGCAGRDVIFFDDNPECVDAARASGLDAHLVRGVDEVRRVIERLT